MSKYGYSASAKPKLKCNLCQEPVAPKDGDWFVSPESHGQQCFLCKKCEAKHKEYRRANLSRT